MRFIDVAPLQFPAGWQVRAGQALNELRAEVEAADAAARAAGEDPAAARKAAILAVGLGLLLAIPKLVELARKG